MSEMETRPVLQKLNETLAKYQVGRREGEGGRGREGVRREGKGERSR